MTIAVMMGVSGSGKTTIARGVAQREGWRLVEGDDYHPPANVAKMHAGTPLTDEDRWPWLRALAREIDAMRERGEQAIVACSALKRGLSRHPDRRAEGCRAGVPARIEGADRRADRGAQGHFMPPALLDSQFATLEEPGADEHPMVVSIAPSPDAIVDEVVRQLKERTA